ncbi:Sapep family Mn(2+)-dependent dipeptidase [Paenochrobactrum sp. BZR 588]|uniref:Sapep family Mn(2+)-dependent dipeptidase n=1 Tax=unclassified Paenochrobactrum TaxID=2639760 RepID=UPI003852277F
MSDFLNQLQEASVLSPNEQAFLGRIDEWFAAHKQEFIADLIDWVSYPSVSDADKAAPDAPFGPEVARLFDRVIERAHALGFKTERHDGYAISILGDDGSIDEDIGLVSHLDVVPAGENWTFEPYQPFERDGFIIGRGSSDNKGPALLDLYLLRAFRELGVGFKRRLRIVYGGAEETSMADIAYFAEHGPVPRLSIITDGGFPVNYAQKGGLNLVVRLPVQGSVLAGLKAGVAANAVPASATLALKDRDIKTWEEKIASLSADLREKISVGQDGADLILHARGQSGHAAFPENTLNPIPLLLRALIEADTLQGADLELAKLIAGLLADPWGKGAGVADEDEQTGKLTLNGGLISGDENGITLHLDIRYPISTNVGQLLTVLEENIRPFEGHIDIERDAKPVHFDKNSSLVQLLQNSFDTVAEAKTQPFSMGGGTHARVLPNSITFGPGFGRDPSLLFQGEAVNARPDFIPAENGSAHGPDEFVAIENLRKALLVYAVTLPRLDRWVDEGLV